MTKLPAVAGAGMIALALAALPARADTCDDILAALNKHVEALYAREAKGAALCVGMGEVIGIFQARRMVASECGRSEIAKQIDETIKAIAAGLPTACR